MPAVVTNRTLKDNGQYAVSFEILDGLLRERQTQDEAVGAGRIVNDTFYDRAGRAWKSNDDYQNGVEKLRSTTERDGDVSTTVPPKGDTVTATFEDAEGRPTRLREYTNDARTTWRDTTYEYDTQDQLVKVTAPGGAVTTFEYDGRGRQIAATDPDGGRTTFVYDNSDHVVSTTDPRGNMLVTTYDAGGRPTSLREDSATGPKRMEWTYDTLGKGLPTASIRYDNGREYREEVTAFDNAYRVKSAKTVIPAEETGLAGTYSYDYSYTPTGNLAYVDVPGLGGLTREKVVFRYDSDDQPILIGGAVVGPIGSGFRWVPRGYVRQRERTAARRWHRIVVGRCGRARNYQHSEPPRGSAPDPGPLLITSIRVRLSPNGTHTRPGARLLKCGCVHRPGRR
ncbi:hypothetical protein [Streptomyces sp. SYSU K217416]